MPDGQRITPLMRLNKVSQNKHLQILRKNPPKSPFGKGGLLMPISHQKYIFYCIGNYILGGTMNRATTSFFATYL